MSTTISKQSEHDIFRFPCGTMCYRFEAQHYEQLGHEYEVHPVGSPEYDALQAEKAHIVRNGGLRAHAAVLEQRPEWTNASLETSEREAL